MGGGSIFGPVEQVLNERFEFAGESPLLPDFGAGEERGEVRILFFYALCVGYVRSQY